MPQLIREICMPDASSFPRTLRVGILVFNDYEPLDVWGFVQAFAIARYIGTGYGDPPPYPFEIVFISNETNPGSAGAVPQPVKSYNGPRVAPDLFRDDALGAAIDVLMIPGGAGTGALLQPATVEAVVDWVRAMDAKVSLMTSVCTGAAILARAGVLDGKPAATNHSAFAWVTSFGPRVLWDNVSRWVDAGRYVTSAGTSAGTDMALHLVARLAGRAVAEAAALSAEYDWHRDAQEPIFYPQQAEVPTTRG
jgi:putative intracellular protease/amidase